MILFALVDIDHPEGIGHYRLQVPTAYVLPIGIGRHLITEHLPDIFSKCHGTLYAGSVEDYMLTIPSLTAAEITEIVAVLKGNYRLVRAEPPSRYKKRTQQPIKVPLNPGERQ